MQRIFFSIFIVYEQELMKKIKEMVEEFRIKYYVFLGIKNIQFSFTFVGCPEGSCSSLSARNCITYQGKKQTNYKAG